MNRAYLLIGIPAFVTSFCWLTFGWGWRLATLVTAAELAAVIAAVFYILRREHKRKSDPQTGQ